MKIAHAADLHLRADLASPEGRLRLAVLEELCARAREAQVLVLAGDIFDSYEDARDRALLGQVKARLEALDRPVIVIPGNHEFLRGNGKHPFEPKPELGRNVELVTQTPFAALSIDKVEFIAFPFQEGKTAGELFKTLPPAQSGACRVAILHGTAQDRPGLRMSAYGEDAEEGQDLLISDRDLKAANFLYVALGHIHKKDDWPLENGARASYPGSACAVRRSEDEPHGFNLVWLDETAGAVQICWEELKAAARAQRRLFMVSPGAEAAAIASVAAWLESLDRGLWPVAKLCGLGEPAPLAEGKRRLEAEFGQSFRLPPEIVLEAGALDAGSKAAGSRIVQDFLAAIRAKAEAAPPQKQLLYSRAMLLGWFALSLGEKKAEDALRKALEPQP